jgi:hypothetical protein
LGPTDGKPVSYYFHPLCHVQGIIPWLLLPLAFVGLKENRTAPAAWIVAPIALLGATYAALMHLVRMDSGSGVQLNALFTIMVLGFTLVWLVAERLPHGNRFVTFLLATLVYFGFLGVNLLSRGFSKDILGIASLAAISIPALMFALLVAALRSPPPFHLVRYLIRVGAALFGALLILFGVAMFVFYRAPNLPLTTRMVEWLTASFFTSLICCVALFPFLVLLFSHPFWRKRFASVWGIHAGSLPSQSGSLNGRGGTLGA